MQNFRVDRIDFDRVNQHKWHLCRRKTTTYLAAYINGKSTLMHRFILNAKKGEVVDHKNSDGLDNRRSNLRICTQQQNTQNKRMNKNNSSGYKGVYLSTPKHKRVKKWFSFLKLGKKTISLGYYLTPEEAAEAYDSGARKYFGEFARTNFIGR